MTPTTDELLEWRHRNAARRDYLRTHRAQGVELLDVADDDVPAGMAPEVWGLLPAPARRTAICGRLTEVDADLIITGAAITEIDRLLAR